MKEEYDEFEDTSRHFLAFAGQENIPCGTARWRFTDQGIKLERFAILKNYRGQGIGASLVKTCLEDIQDQPNTSEKLIYLYAQSHALNFYIKAGFEAIGDEFEEAGIKHFKMIKK